MPKNLNVMSQTWESVQLSWQPGSNGGHDQQFYVAYLISPRTDMLIAEAKSSTPFNLTGN